MSRLLIVDDEPTILKFLVRVLEREGYTVYSADNGSDALRVLGHLHFDLLLTDIKMDGLDGIGLLQEARQKFPELAIILLTGHATVESAVIALQEGAANYLLKPVKNEDVVLAVREALDWREREQRRNKLEALATDFAKVIQNPPSPLETDGLRIDTLAHLALFEEKPLDLTPTEYRLLKALCEPIGATLEYIPLVQAACGYLCDRHEAREIIGTHIRNLRQKLASHTTQFEIESIRGIGYRLVKHH